MYGKKLSTEQALKYIDAHLVRTGQHSIEKVVAAVERVNRLIDDERQFGTGTQEEQLELFEYLVSISRRKPRGGINILAKMMMTKWAEKSQNLYAKAYRLGHDDGNINGSYHATKRGIAKVEKVKKINVNRASVRGRAAADALHSKPGNSRDKQEAIRAAWASGNYSSRDLCAEQECAALNMAPGTARRALRNTPEPLRRCTA